MLDVIHSHVVYLHTNWTFGPMTHSIKISIHGYLSSNRNIKVLYDMVKGFYHGFLLKHLVDESLILTNLAPKRRVRVSLHYERTLEASL